MHRHVFSAALLATSLGLAASARAEDPIKVEKVAKLEGEAAALDVKGGEFHFVKVEVKHQPDAVAIAKGEANPKEQWRPRITVDFANPGNVKLAADVTVELQDEKGAGLLTCAERAVADPKTKSDYKLLCMSKPMLLADWPRVSQVKLSALVVQAEPTLDRAFAFKKWIADVKTKVGPIVVEKVIVTNTPTEADLEKAQKNPADNTRPKVVLLLSNPTDEKVKVAMTVILEDKDGTAFLKCERTDKLAPNKKSDDLTLCMGNQVKTLDFADITHAHVIVAVK